MSRVPTWRWTEDPSILRGVIARGGVLAIPTESSYGLAADPRSEAGVAAIRRIKSRENSKPLPVVTADVEQIHQLGGQTALAARLGLLDLWPAALTLVLPVDPPLPAACGGNTVGFRVPAHARLRELLRAIGHGLTATSANLSGDPPILDPRGLEPLLVRSDAVIVDDGVLAGGEPSTVVEVRQGGIRVLRPGAVDVGAWCESAAEPPEVPR